MARNRMMVFAALVVVAAGLVYFATGHRLPPQGAQGSIGAAQRYNDQQMGTGDVQLTDAEIQAFLQSDTFHKIATDPTFRAAVKSGDIAKLASSDAFRDLMKTNDQFVVLLTQASFLNTAANQDFQKVADDAHYSQLIFSDHFVSMMSNANFRAAIMPEADLQRARTAASTAEATLLAVGRRVEQARATLEGAQDNLAKTTVRSPIDGIVTARRVEEGEVAVIGVQSSPGTVLLTISDMSVVESEMEVDETSIPSVAVGQEARIRIDAFPNQSFQGSVTEVGSSPILTTSVTEAIKFKVKIRIENPPKGIKPGLSVQADILTGFAPQAITIPIQALVLREIERKPGEQPKKGEPRDEEGVWVVDSNKVRFQVVKTGMLGELSLEVKDGLKGGETIVTGPFRALRSLKAGDAVKPEGPGTGGPAARS